MLPRPYCAKIHPLQLHQTTAGTSPRSNLDGLFPNGLFRVIQPVQPVQALSSNCQLQYYQEQTKKKKKTKTGTHPIPPYLPHTIYFITPLTSYRMTTIK